MISSSSKVLNKYLVNIGVTEAYQLVDVYGLDDEALSFIPKPVKALILLFPMTGKLIAHLKISLLFTSWNFSDNYEAHRKKEEETLSGNLPPVPENLFFMRQFVSNSCGTMALIHAVLNNLKTIDLKDGSVIKNFYEKAKGLTPEERGKLLEEDTSFIDIHQAIAAEGQTDAPPSDEAVNNHFIALVNVGNELFELDGRKNFPVSHGVTNEDKFLADSVGVCKEFISRDPKEVNFTVMALAKA